MNVARERAIPKTEQELSKIVARCDRMGEKIRIVGGETLGEMGTPPEHADLTLATTAMKHMIANDRADLVIAAQSGIPIQDVTTLLSAQGRFVPFDVPQPHRATLGGTLAAGWLGPRRHLYGRLRDYLLGSTIVLADGTVARAGGMVVKNVAGYDMSRLYIGSFGTLGVLTRANFKTIPLAPHSRVFLAPLPEHTRDRACTQVACLNIRPAAAFWIDGFHHAIDGDEGAEGRLFTLLEGSDALLERATLELRSALGRAGVPQTRVVDAGAREAFERVVDAYTTCLGGRSITYRLYHLADEAQSRAREAQELAHRRGLRSESIVDLMNGDVVLRVSDLDSHAFGAKIEGFDAALHENAPRAVVVAGKHPLRTSLCVWGAPPPSLDRMRALKARFDPNRTFNPGCFVGGI